MSMPTTLVQATERLKRMRENLVGAANREVRHDREALRIILAELEKRT